MTDVTVKQLANVVGTTPEHLLQQMQEAGLPHDQVDQTVSDDQHQRLISHLSSKQQGGVQAVSPTKITLKRKTISTIKTGAGSRGRGINVEIRKKRTYVKRSVLQEEQQKEAQTKAELVEDIANSAARSDVNISDSEAINALDAAQLSTPSQAEVAASPEQGSGAQDALSHEVLQTPSASNIQESSSLTSESAGIAQANESLVSVDNDRQVTNASQQVTSESESPAAGKSGSTKPHLAPKPEQKAGVYEKNSPPDASVKKPAKKAGEVTKSQREPDFEERSADDRDKKARGKKSSISRKSLEVGKSAIDFGDDELSDDTITVAVKRPARKKITRGSDIKARRRRNRLEPQEKIPIIREVVIPESITVSGLAQRMSVKATEVIKQLMKLGNMATINESLDQETAALIVEELGHKVKLYSEEDIEKELLSLAQLEGEASSRAPVVTVMGHVDHGKTSLLDYIRETKVAKAEAGGITQHIGAYHVELSSGMVTFLDTPGHAAFTAMRARGAKVTDIVVLVVAADDGVMPQTEEAVQHARAAEVPIVVAINKMDKEGADPDRVKNELAAKDVIPESWGGDTQFVEVSAHTGQGIDELLEAILLQSEILELKAVAQGAARGFVVESKLDKGRGPVASLLVQQGELAAGDIVIAGTHFGRVRALIDETGRKIAKAGPSIPVEILGFDGTPDAGEEFFVMPSDKAARELALLRDQRSEKNRLSRMGQNNQRQNPFDNLGKDEQKILNIVMKTDVRGSLEAITAALMDIGNEEVTVRIIGSGVGGITESDAMLATTTNALVIGFNVRADAPAKRVIEKEGLELRYYSVIYDIIDDVKNALSGLLKPTIREDIVGVAEVRDVFRSPKFGQVAGCMVIEGAVHRNKPIRILRDNVVIFRGDLDSLRRFKDDAPTVQHGIECGIGVRNYNDIRVGDLIEVYEPVEVKRTL